jgi:hypothetical protein
LKDKEYLLVVIAILPLMLSIFENYTYESHKKAYAFSNSDLSLYKSPSINNNNKLSTFAHEEPQILVPMSSFANLSNITNDNNNIDNSSNLRINVINPTQNSTYFTHKILVDGTAFSNRSNIDKVEVSFQSRMLSQGYKLATQVSEASWLKWYIPLTINNTGYYRILARLTDSLGNQAWDSVTIQVPFFYDTQISVPESKEKTRIAFVQNTFTESAYSENGFYTFYKQYKLIPKGEAITTNLYMLTTPVPSEAAEEYIFPLSREIKKTVLNSNLVNLVDEDIHEGRIFNYLNKTNAFDVLILFHEEYVTQDMYDNFRKFVNDGGTIIFMDGNVFIAEVDYNKINHSITLVRGHGWKFDGMSAVKDEMERWFNDTREWVGSNFVNRPISAKIFFSNNPFNYSHFEDNYITNPHVTILFDYGASILEDKVYDNNTKIATYLLNNGNGRVIMLGIYSQNLLGNRAFMDFFSEIILPHAVVPNVS